MLLPADHQVDIMDFDYKQYPKDEFDRMAYLQKNKFIKSSLIPPLIISIFGKSLEAYAKSSVTILKSILFLNRFIFAIAFNQ